MVLGLSDMKGKFGKFGIFNIWWYILVYNKHLACEIKFHQNPRIFRNIIFDLSDVKDNFENIYIYIWNLITQYSYITISNTSRSRDTRKNVDLCNFQLVVEIVLCCNMMEKPIYMVFKWFLKNCLKFFTAKKIGEGAKESLARYTAKKIKEKYKKLWPAHSAEMLLSGV